MGYLFQAYMASRTQEASSPSEKKRWLIIKNGHDLTKNMGYM